MSAKILPFGAWPTGSASVGTVHRDGSVTFAGVRYSTIRDVPPTCRALRADVESYVQWKALYNAVRKPPAKSRPTNRGGP